MKNKKTAMLSLILCVALLCGCFAGCTKSQSNSGESGSKESTGMSETGENTVTGEGEKTDKESGKTVTEKDTGDVTSDEKDGKETGKTDGDGKTKTETTATADSNNNKNSNPGKESGKKTDKDADIKDKKDNADVTDETTAVRDITKAKLPDGVKITKISMSRLEDAVNLGIEVTNSNMKAVDVDFSYIVMKLNGKTVIPNTFGIINVGADRTVACSLSVEENELDLGIGRSVSVYYGTEFLGDVIIELF